jgi:hypothetical protein
MFAMVSSFLLYLVAPARRVPEPIPVLTRPPSGPEPGRYFPHQSDQVIPSYPTASPPTGLDLLISADYYLPGAIEFAVSSIGFSIASSIGQPYKDSIALF